MARYFSLGVVALGVVAIASGFHFSKSDLDTNLPEPTATVTPLGAQDSQPLADELNPTITTRDWNTVNASRGRGRY